MCESLAVSAGTQEKGAIGAMFEREMKQEKNLEVSQVSWSVTRLLPPVVLMCQQFPSRMLRYILLSSSWLVSGVVPEGCSRDRSWDRSWDRSLRW